jgi:fatty acid desaturase
MDKETKKRVKSLVERSNIRSFVILAINWAIIASAIAIGIWANHWLVYIPIMFLIGQRYYALSEAITHEACHYNLFKNKKWHYTLEFLYTLPFGSSLVCYREEHQVHHRDLLTENDHIIKNYRDFGLIPLSQKSFFWVYWIRPFLGYATWYYRRKNFTQKKVLLFWALMLTVVVVTGNLWYFFLYHIIPLFYAKDIFLYRSEIGDHYGTETGTRTDVSGFHNFLNHNSKYHAIHHIYPTIPYFNLKKAHETIPHPFDLSNGPWESYRQMRDYHNKRLQEQY